MTLKRQLFFTPVRRYYYPDLKISYGLPSARNNMPGVAFYNLTVADLIKHRKVYGAHFNFM